MSRDAWFDRCCFALLFAQSVQRASVFSTIGTNPLALAHPTGIGTRADSFYWGIASTGTGFLDGTMTFTETFALPTNTGDSAAFGASDIAEVKFRHVESALTPGGTIFPGFLFAATPGQISSASGAFFNNGGGSFTLVNPFVQTTIDGTLPTPGIGNISDEYLIQGIKAPA